MQRIQSVHLSYSSKSVSVGLYTNVHSPTEYFLCFGFPSWWRLISLETRILDDRISWIWISAKYFPHIHRSSRCVPIYVCICTHVHHICLNTWGLKRDNPHYYYITQRYIELQCIPVIAQNVQKNSSVRTRIPRLLCSETFPPQKYGRSMSWFLWSGESHRKVNPLLELVQLSLKTNAKHRAFRS